MADFQELSTHRLTLRRLHADDASALVAYRSLPEVARYQSWESFTREDAIALIANQADVVPDTPGTWLQLAMVETASGTLIGDCGLPRPMRRPRSRSPSRRKYHGRGLATEARACWITVSANSATARFGRDHE